MLRSASKILKFRNSQITTVGNIDFHQYGSFLKIVLNRPKALNSLNLQMIRDLRSQVDKINQNKAFWIEGAGGKAFCAGGDVKALFEKDSTPADRITFFREEFELDYKISQLNALQIANWDGIVMGGGFGVSAFAPFIIATENTMFAMPEAKLGFFTDVGSSYLLSRLRKNIGYYLGMTGARLKGQSVYLSGLAHYYIPSNQIATVYSQIQQSITKSQNTKQIIKGILQKHHKKPQNSFIEHENEIEQLFGLPSVKQIYETAVSKKDKFHVTVVKQLNQQCPISISIIKKLINSAKTKTIKQAFIQDFYLSQHMSIEPNFAEGVRCVLIDKGSTPKWSYQTIKDLNEDDANRYLLAPSSFEKLNI